MTTFVRITNTQSPYDTSCDIDDMRISYNGIKQLNMLLGNNTEEVTTPKTVFNLRVSMIYEQLKDHNIKFVFRFLCSSDCASGKFFIDHSTTENINTFVKKISTRPNTIIEFSDHSMAAFFNNWDENLFLHKCPILISRKSTCGSFEMVSTKENLILSKSDKLNKIGDLSDSEQINITFQNMQDTKIFTINQESTIIVKILSTGISKEDFQEQIEQPVHAEFQLNNAYVIISSTHWCNLEKVETPVSIPRLRKYLTETQGEEACRDFDERVSQLENNSPELKREISNSVRQISSGQNKKIKYEKNIFDDAFNGTTMPTIFNTQQEINDNSTK